MNKAITILLVLLLAQQIVALRINTHLDDESNSTGQGSQALQEIKEVIGKALNDSREPSEANETLQQIRNDKLEELNEDLKKLFSEKLGDELRKTNANGETVGHEIGEKAREDLNKALENGEKELPEVGKKFIETLTNAFNEGYLTSEKDENGNLKIGATEKLNQSSKAGYEAGAEEIKNKLNEVLKTLGGIFNA